MTRVLVAASSAVVRAGLETLVGGHDGFNVAGSAADIESLLREVEAVRPDVVVLDFESETEGAVNALLSLGEGAPPPAVVALTADAPGSWVGEAVRSGLGAALPRESGGDIIVAAVGAAAAGLAVLTPSLVNSLHAGSFAPADLRHDSTADTLTPREVEVLGMLAEGAGNKAIAYHLGISEHTVKFHVASIFAKLGVSSRTEAVTAGLRRGLIML